MVYIAGNTEQTAIERVWTLMRHGAMPAMHVLSPASRAARPTSPNSCAGPFATTEENAGESLLRRHWFGAAWRGSSMSRPQILHPERRHLAFIGSAVPATFVIAARIRDDTGTAGRLKRGSWARVPCAAPLTPQGIRTTGTARRESFSNSDCCATSAAARFPSRSTRAISGIRRPFSRACRSASPPAAIGVRPDGVAR